MADRTTRDSRPGAAPLAADERGQAIVLSALMLGLVLIVVSAGVLTATLELVARAVLSKADSAAALAALSDARPSLTLRVSYTDYSCVREAGGTRIGCRGVPGETTIAGITGDAFAWEAGAFGPLPGWAAAAGCVGTRWSGSASVGTYRVCSAQTPVGGTLGPPAMDEAWRAAQAWLEANVPPGSDLRAARVTAVTVGSAGQLTVRATARVWLPLPGMKTITVAATAWPGQ